MLVVVNVGSVTAVGAFGVKTLTAFADVAVPTVIESPVESDVYASIAVPSVGGVPTDVTFGIVRLVPALTDAPVFTVADAPVADEHAVPGVIVSTPCETAAEVGTLFVTLVTTVAGVTDVTTVLLVGCVTVNGVPNVGAVPTSVTFGIAVVLPSTTTVFLLMFGMLILVVVNDAAVPAVTFPPVRPVPTACAVPPLSVTLCVCPLLLKRAKARCQ